MRAHKSDLFPLSGEVLKLPFALCEDAIIGGLNAAQMRLALVLISHARAGEGFIGKRRLEQLSGVRLSNATRKLAELEKAFISTWRQDYDGHAVLTDIDYTPGERGKLAGIVTAKISADLSWFSTLHQQPDVEIAADELRQYTSVAAIILRLRIGAHFAKNRFDDRLAFRLKDSSVLGVFGSYGVNNSSVERTSVNGEIKRYVSLARLHAAVVAPAAAEINAVPAGDRAGLPGFEVTVTPVMRAAGRGRGQQWASIDLEIKRVKARVRKEGEPSPLAAIGERQRHLMRTSIGRHAVFIK